jgi:hypothetical protein
MKHYKLLLFSGLLLSGFGVIAQTKTFTIFSYHAPGGFALKESSKYIFYEKNEGKEYCQIFLYPVAEGTGNAKTDFTNAWNHYARNAAQKVNDPETLETDTDGAWHNVFGGARGKYAGKQFAITVSSYTKGNLSFAIVAVFTKQDYISTVKNFIDGVTPDASKYKPAVVQKQQTATNTNIKSSNNITLSTTNFDDGWVANALTDYVSVTKAGTEVRLHYTDKVLDDARPNTIDAPEYYWSKYVTPFFNTNTIQKWSGVQYPVIYHMMGNAVDKRTGKQCFVAIKIVYSGGARPIVVIAPNENTYQQLFPHPNDMDRMLNYNKFAVTANDITGIWKGSGGGGVEYYNVYSGTYAGLSAVSTSDEFIFNADGTYSSTYRSANMNNSGAQFGGQDFKGKYTITNWQVTATNRYQGKTTNFYAQLIAVKGGYLLYLSDSQNNSLNYTLFKAR